MARAYRQIAAMDRMVGELSRQPLMRRIGLGAHQQPGRVLVDPMDDTGPLHPVDPRQPAPAMVEQRIDQRTVAVSRRRVDHHPRRLVDDDQMLVLEHDFERNVLRLEVEGSERGKGDGESHALCHSGAGGGCNRAPQGDGPVRDQPLDPFARKVRCLGEGLVEAVRGGKRASDAFGAGHRYGHAPWLSW